MVRHVRTDELKPLPAQQVRDVVRRSGDEVVNADHVDVRVEEPLRKVRADETRATGENSSLSHGLLLRFGEKHAGD